MKNGKYYYLDSNGAMQTGWFQDNRKWYYLSDDGSMQTGWLTLGGSTYYFDGDGSMHTGLASGQRKMVLLRAGYRSYGARDECGRLLPEFRRSVGSLKENKIDYHS